ncbi:hypothetical protein [Streptomyces hygroscopicus]|uniref:hypothetical protein n=1 Tax=Streptomyces hygroscopicus TaxID=1912 RepID=UPI0004C581DB|nr:hypothetical protein [Streptomyces hygroscopicus]
MREAVYQLVTARRLGAEYGDEALAVVPVECVRPLGARGFARALRFHADDPRKVVAALTRVRTDASP